MLPKGYLVGVVTADPTLSTTSNSVPYSRFSVACNESYSKQNQQKKGHFFQIVAWNKTAEYLSSYVKKGDTLFIEFRIATNSYTNKESQNIKTTEFTAEKIEIIKRSSNQNRDQNSFSKDVNNNSFQDNSFDNDSSSSTLTLDEIFEQKD